MHYQIDLDPTHTVIRLTVTAEIVSLEIAEDVYYHLSRFTSSGGPYAGIYDLFLTKDTTIPTDMIRRFARRPPSIPLGRPHVVVGKEPAIYGLARIFQMCREALGGQVQGHQFEVVHSLKEAYDILRVSPEHFTQRIFPTALAA